MVEKLKNFICKFYLLLITLFLHIPVLLLIVLSFNGSRNRTSWGGFSLKWYKKMFSSSQMMDAFSNTILISFCAASIATVIGLLAALGISAMKNRGYGIMLAATNIPMVNADIVTGLALMLWFIKFIPLGFTSVLLAHITFDIPYVVLSVLPRVKQMNVAVYEAARDLGANGIYAFFKVVMPQLYGSILYGFFMALTISMDDFTVTYFTRGAGVNTLSTLIYGELKKGIVPEMYALSTLIFVVVFVILLIVNFGSVRKEKKAVAA
ncbi:MAG: ABC transporter permease [Lachnospiraceae bacterium]|nr:ABC transporter permease [Lachnospiraceae bacterium]